MIRKRRVEERFFKGIMIISTMIVIGVLILILSMVIVKGLGSLNLAMITQTPKGGYYLGKEGGVLNAIVGSLYLAGGATFLAMIVSIPIVLYLNVFVHPRSRFAIFTRFSLDVLWGIPSIVYGAFGFTIMLFFGMKASLISGIITIALLELPIMARTMDEVMKMVPRGLKEASYALGADKVDTAFSVMVRQAMPGIVTGVLVAFGRGIGDTAAVIFTAGFTDYIPSSLFDPVATLPLAIFFQLNTPFPEVQNRAYASAFILTAIILIVCIASRVVAKRYTKHIVK